MLKWKKESKKFRELCICVHYSVSKFVGFNFDEENQEGGEEGGQEKKKVLIESISSSINLSNDFINYSRHEHALMRISK